MNPLPHRRVIYPKDVSLILGRSERSARRIMQAIRRKSRNKTAGYVTLAEFCEFTGLKEDAVIEFLK